ncbi:MAG: tRNA lysidine(34) synthetase TilS [bacterium JZ-2024 1]
MQTSAPFLFRKVVTHIRRHGLIQRGDSIVIALSGGKDSVALADFLQRLAPRWNLRLYAYHLNHGLREKESDDQEAFVRAFCEERGIPAIIERRDVAGYAQKRGISLEMAGRRIRYERLFSVAERVHAERIATAHTLSDQLETLLLHIVMGTGLKGLAGIPAISGPVIRPLLCVWAHEVLQYLKERRIPWFEDTSNQDLRIPRNYIRHRVVAPLLSAMEGRVLKTLPGTLQRLSDEVAVLQRLGDALNALQDKKSLRRCDLITLPDALALACLHSFLTRHSSSPVPLKTTQGILHSIQRDSRGNRRWHLTKDHELVLAKGTLRVVRRND